MKAKAGKLVLFLVGLVLLQQGIAYSNRAIPQMHVQSELVVLLDIDPAAIFYIESELALAAEKKVRQSIANSK